MTRTAFIVVRQPCHEELNRAEARFAESQRRLDAASGFMGTDVYQDLGNDAAKAWDTVRAARAKVHAWFAAALVAHDASR